MKALMLAAVMALGGTGASALDVYELISKGTLITMVGNKDLTYFSYKGIVYGCSAAPMKILCRKAPNSTVKD